MNLSMWHSQSAFGRMEAADLPTYRRRLGSPEEAKKSLTPVVWDMVELLRQTILIISGNQMGLL